LPASAVEVVVTQLDPEGSEVDSVHYWMQGPEGRTISLSLYGTSHLPSEEDVFAVLESMLP
jgi:hypothetical protein